MDMDVYVDDMYWSALDPAEEGARLLRSSSSEIFALELRHGI